MQLDPQLLEILACPQCHAALRVDEPAQELVCTSDTCGLAYPSATTSPCCSSTRRASRPDERALMAAAIDETVLDDADKLSAGDPGGMLRAVATAGAQVREAALRIGEVDLSGVVADGRPRAVLVAGMGGSGISGDVLAAVAGRLPGPADRPPRLPAARLGGADGPGGLGLLLGPHRGDAGRHRRGAAPGTRPPGGAGPGHERGTLERS